MFSADYLMVLAVCVAAVVFVIYKIANETFDDNDDEGGIPNQKISPRPYEPAPEVEKPDFVSA